MARAKNKEELLESAQSQYEKLMNMIDFISKNDQNKAFTFSIEGEKEAHWERDKNVRDVLIHLYEWQQLLLKWVASNQKGEAKQFLLEPYNWKNIKDMNLVFWEKHQTTNYEDAKRMLVKSHQDVVKLIEQFDNKELFEKETFKWVGGSTLGSYMISVTASHYDWAMKKLKKHIKTF